MARTVKNPKIDSRTARLRLEPRKEPFWTPISAGCSLGYRRGAKGGTWVGRFRKEDGKQTYEALGAADDARDPDGLTVFSFAQAQERARGFFDRSAREAAGHEMAPSGPYTVADAMTDYLGERERKGSKGVRADRYAAEARILPELGHLEVRKLTAGKIKAWLTGVANSPKLRRTVKGAPTRTTAEVDLTDPDAVRARRATSNRLLTVLKAALNFAFHENLVGSDEAWRRVKPFKETDQPVVHFLSADECRRLVDACHGSFKDLVRGALVSGARYGELCRMKVEDYQASSGMITVRQSKAGRARHIALTDEGQRVFSALANGRKGRDLLFTRHDGMPWGPSHQQRPLAEAAEAARLDPPPTFHILRHTLGSALAAKGVSLQVIADVLGHADTRVTERHYARLAPSYIADTVRAALAPMGIMDADATVVPFATRMRS